MASTKRMEKHVSFLFFEDMGITIKTLIMAVSSVV